MCECVCVCECMCECVYVCACVCLCIFMCTLSHPLRCESMADSKMLHAECVSQWNAAYKCQTNYGYLSASMKPTQMWEQGTFHFVLIFSCTGTHCGCTSYWEAHETSSKVWYVFMHIQVNLNVTLSFLVTVINYKTLWPQRSLSVLKWFCEWLRVSRSKRLTTVTFCSDALAFFRAKRGRHVLRKRDRDALAQAVYWDMSSFTTASSYMRGCHMWRIHTHVASSPGRPFV